VKGGAFDLYGPSEEDMLDPVAFYGTYYCMSEDFAQYTLTISSGVNLKIKNLWQASKEEDYTNYRFYTAEYMAKKYNNSRFAGCGALVVDDTYIYWITSENGENPEFTAQLESGAYMEFTTTEKSLDIVTGNPKNYYGNYTYQDGSSLKIIDEDTCSLYLPGNNMNGASNYIYANRAILEKLNIRGDSGIVIYKDSKYLCFIFEDKDLVLNGQYTFEYNG